MTDEKDLRLKEILGCEMSVGVFQEREGGK